MSKKLIITAILLILAMPAVQADRRKYAFTYQTTTLSPEATEFEFYQTTKVNEGVPDKWEYRIEVEQGLSERLDVSVYQIFTQTQGEAFKWDAVQIRTRYRLGLPGDLFLDPVLYFEYRRKVEHTSGRNKFETKILLGKDFEKVNFSVNPVHEYLWASGFDSYQELGVDAGLSYSPSFKLSIGVESSSRKYFYTDETKIDKFKTALGPVVSYASGHTFFTVGVLYGLDDDADDTQVRLLMGVGL